MCKCSHFNLKYLPEFSFFFKVDLVKKSVETALSTALSISNKIEAPKIVGENALRTMREAYQLTLNDQKVKVSFASFVELFQLSF